MSKANPFVVDVGAYWKSPGESRHEKVAGHLEDIRVLESYVPNDEMVAADVKILAVIGGMEVKGDVMSPWRGQCRRCLTEVIGLIDAKVDEFYTSESDNEETYQLEDSKLDLEPLVRDAVVLELPLAPLCKEDCAGLCPACGTNWNKSTCNCVRDIRDPRWAALDKLQDDK